MGKKRITNKFAAVKRMISTQDQRLYITIYSENKTKLKKKNTNVKENKLCSKQLLMVLKSDKCICTPIQSKRTFMHVFHS